jgi:predicted AAA+ superfamily ATPase
LPYVSLEEPDIRQIVLTDGRGLLVNYPSGSILDEIQNTPDLFSYIQKLVGENKNIQFILTGSSNFLLMGKSVKHWQGVLDDRLHLQPFFIICYFQAISILHPQLDLSDAA